MKFLFESGGPAKVEIHDMTIEQVRARLSEVSSLQAKLDAEKLALNVRMISLMHDPVTPTFVIPER